MSDSNDMKNSVPKVYYTNYQSYFKRALESYIDEYVFQQMDDLEFDDDSDIKFTRIFLTGPLNLNQIIYSAMAIESYINLLGAVVFGEKTYLTYYDRYDYERKLSHILEVGLKIESNWKKEPLKRVKKLNETRNKLVHDKGFVDYEFGDMAGRDEKREIDIDGEYALSTVEALSKFLEEKVKGKFNIQSLLTTQLLSRWQDWLNNEWSFICDENTLFVGVKMPNKYEYDVFKRRHTGAIKRY
jgi:hypothetical protein